MKIVLLFLLVHGALGKGQPGFGVSYLKDSKLCHPWTCINRKLGFIDPQPSKKQYSFALKTIIPEAWSEVVDSVLNVCYGDDKPRRYTNTCPGQAMLHCVVDNLIDQCPEDSLRKNDACAPLSSLAGFKYMFSQSRYDELEKNLPRERRPQWFLKNYFSSKCCDLPQMFSSEDLSECGFNSLVHYYTHAPRPQYSSADILKRMPEPAHNIKPIVHGLPYAADKVKVVEHFESDDPLDCCDMSDFIPPSSRSECRFQLTWDTYRRLQITDTGMLPTTTTTTEMPESTKLYDVKVVPLSCEKETCVFKQLNIISPTGSMDYDAYSKLLDNFTNDHPEWKKAKARVFTKCLTKPIKDYVDECEINIVLACTFDVLSENCPHNKKDVIDHCRHTHEVKNDTICQINSSKLRPKNRRQFCNIPHFIPQEAMTQCSLTSIHSIEAVPVQASEPRRHLWRSNLWCKPVPPSASCLLQKLQVLNKYHFVDYFKLKDLVRNFTSTHHEWSAMQNIYEGQLMGRPFLYPEQCSDGGKLLNVLDSMLMTCPVPRRKNTPKCNKLFNEIIKKPVPNLTPIFERFPLELFKQNFRFPSRNALGYSTPRPRKFTKKAKKYDPNTLPEVVIKRIEPQVMHKPKEDRPLILTPVYMRSSTENPAFETSPKAFSVPKSVLARRPSDYDSSWRKSDPFLRHTLIANAHGYGDGELQDNVPMV